VVSPGGKRYNPGMNFDIQPEDEFLLSLSMEMDDYTDLKAYLKDQSVVVSERDPGMAFDQALDPHGIRYFELVVKVAHGAMQFGKDAVPIALLLSQWVQKHNEKKKDKIEAAKESAPLLFDYNGRRIDIFRKTKRNKR
jgi:hypothetical protein